MVPLYTKLVHSEMNSDLVPSTSVARPSTLLGVHDETRSFGPRGGNTMQELLRILVKRAKWVIAAIILAVCASVGLGLTMKPVYESRAIIELNKSNSGAASLDIGGDLGRKYWATATAS